MKVAVSGAHKTGKTTLGELLCDSLDDFVFKKEPYHQLEGEGHTFSQPPSIDDFLLQLDYSIEQIAKSEDNVIFDRCPIDYLAYIFAVDNSKNQDFGSLYYKVESIMTEIDLLVFVPIEEPDFIICGGSDLPELREQLNEILYDLIWDFDLEILEVQGALENRMNQVIKQIQTLSC